MDDRQWIQRLQNGMRTAGWTPVGPDQTGEGWIAGAVRFEAGSTEASGCPGSARRPRREPSKRRTGRSSEICRHRPDSLPEGEGFEHEFDGIPDADVGEIRSIRADFHRHGYDLRWFHPADGGWSMQWTPHGGEVTPVYGQVGRRASSRGWICPRCKRHDALGTSSRGCAAAVRGLGGRASVGWAGCRS